MAVGSITVNDYGYVSIVFGQAASPINGFYVLQNGMGQEDGGDEQYVASTVVGLNAESLP